MEKRFRVKIIKGKMELRLVDNINYLLSISDAD
jgi:hypothetical protein